MTPSSSTTPHPRRKNRSKTRKPKYLSLRLQLNPTQHEQASDDMSSKTTSHHQQQQQQLNLFPLHPENLVDDKLEMMMQDDQTNVAFLFTSSHGAPASLTALLRHDSTATTEEEEEEDRRVDEESGRSMLVRKAMKRGSKEEEEEEREERWVCYSEVTSYSSGNTTDSTATTTTSFGCGLLSLKLDYEGVLNAWSDQRSLYVPRPGETPLPLSHHLLIPNKRESRLFSKRIRYEVRKLNAEKRPRMKGRFVKRD
ncbi:Zinc finger protein like [Senna tora]|uniref:Zinc finger protein like n=1 Tax=Senna tora TaxID=362788 RepID=A0A834WDM0_9FABA|nr:Zinc finger protein like [Senna tora]